MNLVHDILDVQLVARDERNLGRVDGLVLELRHGAAPRVTAMEVGPGTLLARLHPRLERIWHALARRLGLRDEPVRVPMSAIRDIGVDIEIEISDKLEGELLHAEDWVKRHIIEKIPGGGGE